MRAHLTFIVAALLDRVPTASSLSCICPEDPECHLSDPQCCDGGSLPRRAHLPRHYRIHRMIRISNNWMSLRSEWMIRMPPPLIRSNEWPPIQFTPPLSIELQKKSDLVSQYWDTRSTRSDFFGNSMPPSFFLGRRQIADYHFHFKTWLFCRELELILHLKHVFKTNIRMRASLGVPGTLYYMF